MKIAFTAIVVLGIALSSCDNLMGYVKGANHAAEDSAAAKRAHVAARDVSITAENAYSNLFIDSAAVEDYIQTQQLNDSSARQLRNFYNQRNFQFAWFSHDGFTEQGRGFWNLYTRDSALIDTTQRIGALQTSIDSLMEMDTFLVNAADSTYLQTELALTHQYVQYAQTGGVRGKDFNFYIPAKKMEALQLADSLLNRQKDSSFEQNNPAYRALKSQLQKYYSIATQGGWQKITDSTVSVMKGIVAPVVVQIKKRLAQSGDWSSADTSKVFNDSLHQAILSFQQRHGFEPNGIVTDSLIRVMNVPAQERLEQILVNMNRLLWAQPRPDDVLEVNIPSFMLQVYQDKQKIMEMPVVVGKAGTSTLMFDGTLNQVVFSPSWNIPASIVKSEILPAMKADAAYLKKNNMEIVRQTDSLPVIRQLPGANNALGKVKFLFPNSYDIYFHDSPAKNLFAQNNRAFSHGCIRLAEAGKLAEYLLRNDSSWTPAKITTAMNSGKEQTVNLKEPVPVKITYYTAWVDENGQINFREDIYGHDARTRRMMFT